MIVTPDTVPPEVRPVARSADEASATPVVEGVVRLRLPVAYTATAAVNAFLLERDDGWCLVDCGTSAPPGWPALEHALDLAGVAPSDIRLLVCTHPHADHYGLAAEVMERSGCPLALAPGPTASAEMLRDPVIPVEQRLELARRGGVPDRLLAAAVSHPGDDGKHARPEPDLLLEEGTMIETRAGSWRTVPAPGHSPAQVVLFQEESGMLLSADLAIAARIPYLEYGYTADPFAEHVASLERALALEPRLLLPGHGSPTTDAAGPIAAALAAIEAAPGLILAAISDEPRSAFEAIEAVLDPDVLHYPRQVALSGAMCILDRLERLGAVRGADEPDGARRYLATGNAA